MKQYIKLAAAGLFFMAGLYLVLGLNHKASIPTIPTAIELNESVSTENIASVKASTDAVGKKQVYQVSLEDSNTVLLTGVVDESAIAVAQEISAKAKRGPIFLLINSPGGSVLDGVSIVSAIQAAQHPVYTICLQICASMASIVFEAGTKRLMVDRSVLMFHEAAGGIQGQFNQMKTRLNFFNRLVSKMDYEIATRVGVDPETFHAQLANEIWLDAEDAVKQNYADKLVNINIQAITSESGPNNRFKSQTNALKQKVNITL